MEHLLESRRRRRRVGGRIGVVVEWAVLAVAAGFWAVSGTGCDSASTGNEATDCGAGSQTAAACLDTGVDSSLDAGRDGSDADAAVRDSGMDAGRGGSDGGDADAGTESESEFETEVSLPVSCDSDDPEVSILEPGMFSNHEEFEDALEVDDKRIFCLKPGDYRKFKGDHGVFLKTGGTEQQRRYLVYHNPSMSEETHPWNMDDPDQKDGDVRALLPRIHIRSPYWTLDRLRVDSSRSMVNVDDGAHHTIINRGMFYDIPGEPVGKEPHNIAVKVKKTHHVWVQNSVMGDFPTWDVGNEPGPFEKGTSGNDNLAMVVVGSDFVYFVDNEAWDPFNGDIVQTQYVNAGQDSIKRTVVADNDMWLTDDMQTKPYENAIDFKKGPSGGPKSEWAVIQNNRIWNFDNESESMSWEVIMLQAQNSDGYIVRDNVFWDNQASAIFMEVEGARHIVEGNLIYNQTPQFDKGGFMFNAPVKESTARNNILVDAPARWIWRSGDSEPVQTTISHNVFINSDVDLPQLEPANSVTANAFYNSEPFQGSNSNRIDRSSAAAAEHESRTVRVREITGPRTVTIPKGRVTSDSPHSKWW